MAGKMVKSLGGNSNSQSVRDRLNAAKHSISGSGLAKSICKATTDQVISPKQKHLHYLTLCTNEPNVSIPEMADKLLQRTQDTSWVVVFKALITVHNLMNQGNERFTQYVASNNRSVNLQNFSDKSGVQGYDMSLFIRRYARYINQKAVSYRTMAFDFCRIKRGKTDGVLRTMPTEKLLKALPVIQEQVDALVDFDATPNELCNNVINAAFILLFNDLIRLFACYNDGVINLLEQYFDMNKKQCREALDIYKKFVLRMEKVSSFLRVAEDCGARFGIDKGDIPDLAKAPSSLLEALEQHLASLEGRKITTTSSVTSSSGSGRSGDKSGSSTQVNGSSAASYTLTQAERHKIIEEEKARLAAFKEQRQLSLEKIAVTVNQSATSMQTLSEETLAQPTQPTSTASAPVNHPPVATAASAPPANNSTIRPSDDLLGMFEGTQAPAPAPAAPAAWPTTQTNFGREVNFEAAFGSQTQPATEFGNILQPQSNVSKAPNQPPTLASDATIPAHSVISSDIDMSLASLAGNLNISDSGNMKKQDHKWINPSVTMQQRTGGTTFTGPTIASGPTISWAPPAMNAPATMPMNQPSVPAWQGPGMFMGAQPVQGAFAYPGQGVPMQQMPPGAFAPPGYAATTQQQPVFFPNQQRPPGPPTDPFGL